MGLMRRTILPGARATPQLPIMCGLGVFFFLLGFFTGGSLHFTPHFDGNAAAADVAATGQAPAVAPRRLQVQQQLQQQVISVHTSSSSSEADSSSTTEAVRPSDAAVKAPQLPSREQQQQQQQQQHGQALAPGLLPDHESFTKLCLEQSGLLKLRPPLQPASSGNNHYTLFPYQILSWFPRILVFPNFVSHAEALHIISLAQGRMAPSGLAWRKDETPDPNQQTRTSTGVFLSREDDPLGVLAELEDRIASVTMLPVSHGEAFNVLRYELNQRYESHMDTFDPKDFGPQPSQRMATMLFYLSDVEEGGETVFKREGAQGANRPVEDWSSCEENEFKYRPRVGDAVLFYSLDPDLTINPRSLHGGCAVKRGQKFVATKWIHEKPVNMR